jgi:hypothetical protein
MSSSRKQLVALAAIGCLASLMGAGCGGGSGGGGATSTASGSGQAGSAGNSVGGNSGVDNSIQAYGSAAAGAEKAMLAATAFSFFRALARADYAKACAELAGSNRAQLAAFLKAGRSHGGCPAVLKKLVPAAEAAAARKAAAGTLTGVRVKGDTAFVLFHPADGKPSYFAMKREGDAWKAISLAPGTPLELPTPSGH